MRQLGFSIFLLISLMAHIAGAALFVIRPEPVLEERGAGEAALEIGGLFDSAAQVAVEPETVTARMPVEDVAPVVVREVTTVAASITAAVADARIAEPVASNEARPVTALAAQPVQPPETPLLTELTAHDDVAAPDISKPVAVEVRPVEARAPVSPSLVRIEAQVEPEMLPSPAPRPKKVMASKTPPRKPAQKTQKKAERPAQDSSVALKKGGNKAQAGGKQGARGGDGGKTLSAQGTALVANYKGKVRARLNWARRYPSRASSRHLTGVAVVQFTIQASGAASGIRLARSSGEAVLDEAALDTVRRAAPFPELPEPAGRAMNFTVPIAFKR